MDHPPIIVSQYRGLAIAHIATPRVAYYVAHTISGRIVRGMYTQALTAHYATLGMLTAAIDAWAADRLARAASEWVTPQ